MPYVIVVPMASVRLGFQQMFANLPCRSPVSPADQLGNREIAGAVDEDADADDQIELAFDGPHLGDIDEEADRIALEAYAFGERPPGWGPVKECSKSYAKRSHPYEA